MLYPKFLQWIGGRNALIKKLQQSDQEMASQGITMQSVVIGEVAQIRRTQAETFVVVPETLEMATGNGVRRTDSYLLGISSDDGKAWQFIDGAGIAGLDKDIYILLPNLPADLLPQPKQPALAPAKTNPAVARKGAADNTAVTIDRAFYTAKLPKGSTIDAPKSGGNADLLTTANLPTGDTLIIIASDNLAELPAAFNDAVTASKAKVKRSSVSPSDLFKSRGGRGSIVSGALQGVPYSFEIGTFTSKKKGFILLCTYEQAHSDETRQIVRQILNSFVAKD